MRRVRTKKRTAELRPRAALTVDFLKSRRSGLLPALGNELLWSLRRLSWSCGAGRPGCEEGFPGSNCAQERSGRTDRGPAEPHGAHFLKSALPVALRGGGPSGGAADSLIAAAVHYARSGRRCDGCRCAACPRVP